ncbi:hypothetical protein, partial [Archangium sp.]|uniref:hypothetical protein n=1 Tax=Archangium sp. TaxID=1872627 RepID=UPI002ED9D00A
MLRTRTEEARRPWVLGLFLTVILVGTRGAAQTPSKAEEFFGKEEVARQVGEHEKRCKKGDAGECFNLA